MDPEQTFLRVHARLSGVLARLLTPKFRAVLEYLCLFSAAMLLALLVVMHVNFVAQPGCSMEFLGEDVADAQLMQVKITGSWNLATEGPVTNHVRHEGAVEDPIVLNPIPKDNNEKSESTVDVEGSYCKGEGWNILAPKFWLNLMSSNARRRHAVIETFCVEREFDADGHAHKLGNEGISTDDFLAREVISGPLGPGRDHFGTALLHNLAKWSGYVAVCIKRAEQSMRSFWQVWRITGWEPFTASPKGDRRGAAWSKLDPLLVNLSDKGRKVLDPTYLYSMEKGYLMLSEAAKLRHTIKTVNVTISAQNSCFGNRWQQLLIDNFVGYDTILMNSLLHARGKGYLYNFQTKELYNLNYLQDFSGVPHGIEDYVVFKCGVLITSLFVFFTTTMSVSFTLRETQARMLKFTVQLQHHARHRLPTYRLIFMHVVESLVFVPIMIGILFFLFEFFDDQLLAFMILTLVWLCELYTMISVRTPFSMRYFPRFFFLYFMVFHIYFFSYTYGFSYLAFSATGAFMQHLVLYFWNQFEVPALQNFLRRRALFQQQGLHISSAIVQVARLTNSSSILGNSRTGPLIAVPQRTGNPEIFGQNAANSQANPFSPEGLVTRNSQGSVYPVSFRDLGPFSVDGNRATFESERTRNGTLRSLILSSPSPDIVPGEMASPGRIPVGIDAGVRREDEGVTGTASFGNTAGYVHRDSVSESLVPTRNAVHSGGTLSSLGAVLPWIIGSGTATVISLLPSFREFREDHQELTVAVTSDQEGGEESLTGRVRSDSRLRRRSVPARPSISVD